MRKDYDENNRYILEDKSFVDIKTNECLNFGIKDLSRVAVQLNCMERYLNNADQKIAELKEQLKENEKIIQMQQNIERYDIGEVLTENIKLRQQLNSQPAEIVGKIRQLLGLKLEYKHNENVPILKICNQINEVLDTILKEYGGEDEQ